MLAIVFFFIGRAVIHGIQKMVKHSMQRANADTGVIQFVESFLKFGLYALLLFMIATNFGIETSSVAALIASGRCGNRSRAAGESFELGGRRTDPAFETVCSR